MSQRLGAGQSSPAVGRRVSCVETTVVGAGRCAYCEVSDTSSSHKITQLRVISKDAIPELCWSYGTVAGCCESGDELSGSGVTE
jgi:hypothetical protein